MCIAVCLHSVYLDVGKRLKCSFPGCSCVCSVFRGLQLRHIGEVEQGLWNAAEAFMLAYQFYNIEPSFREQELTYYLTLTLEPAHF